MDSLILTYLVFICMGLIGIAYMLWTSKKKKKK